MDNPKDLSPLAKGDIEIGKALPFAIFDRSGVLLLAEGQAVNSQKQLDELAAKGLYHNPRWANKFVIQPGKPQIDPNALPRMLSAKQAFEDPFETGSQLKMSAPGQSKDPFHVRLIGSIPQAAILITHPMRDGKCVFAKEGQVWEFQATYGLSIYRFSSMIEKVLLSPHPLIVMSWPHETHLESQAIRRARRVNCDLPATIRLNGSQSGSVESITAVIDNISTGGLELLFAKAVSFKIGQSISIAFQIILDDRKYLIECDAEVVSKPRDSGPSSSTYGFALKSLNDEQFAVIHAFVSDRLNHRLGPQLYSK
ncbi:flagellar brake protein [Limnobacter profundi]|uniref:Flagellar brake protein n=1 Tax=Limnobacter profundi TaxID=2732163 RepID=A0ABX6N418_9BURK|nr:PilZ domain-containing protein [Limnobacter sp. SAORIC-580]QJR28655.1 flagellar brake protein [Limnobacter sp. SAORIC-580]